MRMSNKTLCCLPERDEEILEGGEVREREEHLEDVAVELLPAPRELEQEGLHVESRDPPLQLALDQLLDRIGVLLEDRRVDQLVLLARLEVMAVVLQ